MSATDINFDFGDPELNDPQYEQKIDNPQGDGNGTPATTPTDGDGQGGAGQAPAQQPASQPAGDDTVTGGQGDKAAPGEQRPADDKAGAAKPRSDDKGNLIDDKGNIIAQAGAERRHFERVQQQQRYISRLERELTEARNTDSMAKALNEVPQKLGLSMQETELGLQVISSFKRDPVATARWALQETMRMGYNLQQIIGSDARGQVSGGSMDLQAVRRMIDEAVQPLVGDREAQTREQQVQETAQREYDAFVAKHEHATVHDDVLAEMLLGEQGLTPEVAYWRLREYAARNGLDFSKPLREQVQARQQGQNGTGNGNATPQSQTHQRMPMPNGGTPPSSMQQGPTMADPDEAWDAIVRQSLADAGLIQ